MEKFKPCPYCGEVVDLKECTTLSDERTFIICMSCGMRGPDCLNIYIARDAWNNLPRRDENKVAPPWDDYFMQMARHAATRSTCLRRKVGAVAVLDRHVLATGYNGAPSGLKHCEFTGCLREQQGVPSGERHEICRGLHAEQNVIIQAAVHGVSLKGATIYVTATPCVICAKMLINCGIKRVVCGEQYPDGMALEMLRDAGVVVEVIDR